MKIKIGDCFKAQGVEWKLNATFYPNKIHIINLDKEEDKVVEEDWFKDNNLKLSRKVW